MSGSFPLFKAAGISVSVHWSWLLVAFIELQDRQSAYEFRIWNVVEYITLFGIVLLHEFGHALACRQVGGRADHIILWPLGGIAFVAPPMRPGAWLWSIAAGPLVNLVLVPITLGASFAAASLDASPDVNRYLENVAIINLVLLGFNLLPVYPLDGGQILQSLLWFAIGFARSLLVVSVIGLVVAAVVIALALAMGEIWWLVLAGFVGFRSFVGFQQARLLARSRTIPRRSGVRCPDCGAHPPVGDLWTCGNCHTRFDTFAHGATCPTCGKTFPVTTCPDCGRQSSIVAWFPQRRE
jgi:Zn-dependent protease